MKAILINFDGEIHRESLLMGAIEKAIAAYTTAEKANGAVLDDCEVASILAGHIFKQQQQYKKDPKLEVIRDFCKKIIAETGSPALKKNEILCQDICQYLIKQNRAVIASPVCIIANIATEKNRKEYEKVLNEYGLNLLPGLLRDVNPIFKFY